METSEREIKLLADQIEHDIRALFNLLDDFNGGPMQAWAIIRAIEGRVWQSRQESDQKAS